jgi:hypothetical protein
MARILDLDSEPGIVFSEAEDGAIVASVWFAMNRHSIEQMERFARNISAFLKDMLQRPQCRISCMPLL